MHLLTQVNCLASIKRVEEPGKPCAARGSMTNKSYTTNAKKLMSKLRRDGVAGLMEQSGYDPLTFMIHRARLLAEQLDDLEQWLNGKTLKPSYLGANTSKHDVRAMVYRGQKDLLDYSIKICEFVYGKKGALELTGKVEQEHSVKDGEISDVVRDVLEVFRGRATDDITGSRKD